MKLLALVVLAACGKSEPAKEPAKEAAPPKPEPPKPAYAGAFVKGASWTFIAETKTTPPADLGKPTVEPKPDVTCTVTDVRDQPLAMATVTCKAGDDAAPTNNRPPAGLYVADAAGLYWFDPTNPETQAKAAKPDPKELLIPATAATRKLEGKTPEDDASWIYETTREGEAWCGYYTMVAGDEAGWGVCFDAKGIVKANQFSAGGTTTETFYQRK